MLLEIRMCVCFVKCNLKRSNDWIFEVKTVNLHMYVYARDKRKIKTFQRKSILPYPLAIRYSVHFCRRQIINDTEATFPPR